MASKSDIVKKYGPYYHITSPTDWKTIQQNELQPKDFGKGYSSLATRTDPLICFTAEHRKDKWIQQLCDKIGTTQVVRIKVAAESIVNRDFDLDYTSSETEFYLSQCTDFEYVLKKSGDIACFESIPISEIVDHEIIECR